MLDWLTSAFTASPIEPDVMALRIGVAAVLGLVISGTYRVSHGRGARDSTTLATTIVLLTTLLAMVSMVIGESVARAFGLVGALSIVRFRTVVEDTRDTAFVIFAVIVGMAVGTGLLWIAAIGVPIVGIVAIGLHALAGNKADAQIPRRALTVRLALGHDPDKIAGLIRATTGIMVRSMLGVRTVRQGSAIELSYSIQTPDALAVSLVLSLNTLEGELEVELSPPSIEPDRRAN